MLPQWETSLPNLYHGKRQCRSWDRACLVRNYRKILVEKKRLLAAGVPYIEVHLWCRYLTNPANRNAQARLENYLRQGRLFADEAKL